MQSLLKSCCKGSAGLAVTMYVRCSGAMFMFPGCLAEGPFSLRSGERGTALSLSAELSWEGELQNPSIVASHVVPTEKMTYDELDESVASGSSKSLPESLQTLLEVLHRPSEYLQACACAFKGCYCACQCICQAMSGFDARM